MYLIKIVKLLVSNLPTLSTVNFCPSLAVHPETYSFGHSLWLIANKLHLNIEKKRVTPSFHQTNPLYLHYH